MCVYTRTHTHSHIYYRLTYFTDKNGKIINYVVGTLTFIAQHAHRFRLIM